MTSQNSVKRYVDTSDCGMYADPEGEYILFSDHERAIKQARADALEEAAQIAGTAYEYLNKTREAHYRLSPVQFDPIRFGFNLSITNYSSASAMAIRDLIEKEIK